MLTLPAPDPGSFSAALQLSPECTDLLGRIFVVDAERRITLEQIEQHPW